MGGPTACEVCGSGEARYVCRHCNRRICERCLDPRDWTCLECKAVGALMEGPVGSGPWPLSLSLLALLFSFALIFIGMALIALSSVRGQGFGLILIGPMPIILGTGSEVPSRVLVGLALILSLAFLIYALTRGRRSAWA